MGVPVNLTLHLSDKFVAEVTKANTDFPAGTNGVNVYLWYNKPSSGSHFTQVVNNGTLVSGNQVSIQLTNGDAKDGGKVYLLVQSEAHGATHSDLVSLIGSAENQINQSNAMLWHFGYDTFEVTLKNSVFDVANLSAIDNFSHQLGISVTYADGTTAARGYGKSALDFDAAIKALAADASGGKDPLAPWPTGSTAEDWHKDNDTMLVITPAAYGKGVTDHEAFTPDDWSDYVTAIETLVKTDTPIEISGMFNGAQDNRGGKQIWHNPGYFSYTLTTKEITASSGSKLAPGTYFMLAPDAGSQVQGYIFITPDALKQNLYKPGLAGADALAYLYVDAAAKTPFNIDGSSPDGSFNTGENNAWGKVFTTLFTGFSGGYFGAEAHSVLGQKTTLPGSTIDLSKSYNWDPTYAFDGLRSNPTPAYQHYDPYAKLYFDESNVYGGAYSDALTSRFDTSVLIPVSDKGGQNVSNIDLWVFGRDETMGNVPGTSVPFYTPNEIRNLIAPPTGQDYGKVTLEGNSQTPNFVVSLASNGMVLDTDTMDVKIGFYLGDGKFQYVSVPKGAAQNGGGFWQVWKVVEDTTKAEGSRFSLQSVPIENGTPYTPSTFGNFTVTALPTVKNSTLIYQVVVGNATVGEKTFNVTVKTDGSSKWTDYAVDGMARANASFAPGTPGDAFTVVVLDGALEALPGAMLEPDTSDNFLTHAPHPLIAAPVAGHGTGSSFVALAGQNAMAGIRLELTAADTLNFGWTGTNSDVNVPSWIYNMTNKVHAGYTAKVTIEKSTNNGGSYTAFATATGVGDLDGQWTTNGVRFADTGLYRVTMKEFTPGANGQAYSLATPELLLNFTIKQTLLGGLQLGAMTPTEFNMLEFGGTQVINVVDNRATLTLDQAFALGSMIMHPADHVTVAATGAELAALTPAQLAALAAQGVDILDATDDALVLTVAQYLAMATLKMKLTAGDEVTLRDGTDAIAALGTSGLKSLGARLVDVLDSTDGELRLSVDALLALGGVTLDPSDTVTATAHGLRLTLLTQAEIAQLGAAGVDAVDSTTRVTGLTNGQLKAFDSAGISLSADDLYLIGAGLGDDVIDVTGQPFGPDDLLSGSTGDDLYRVGTSGAKAIELPFSGQDTVESAASYTLFPFIEALVLVGTDDIDGTGSATASHLTGNAGNNRLTGLGGEDSLAGGDGNDTLIGGRGADDLTGGAGADAFRFLSNRDGMDTIHGFTPGEDRIELSLLAFGALGPAGPLDPERFNADAPVGKIAQLVYDTVSGLLTWDADGTGPKAPVLLAQLEGAPSLSAADLALVA